MKKYLVTKTYEQEVEAENEEKAEEIAEGQHMDNPEYDTEVKEVFDEPQEIVITIRRSEDNEGYMFDVYDNCGDAEADNNSFDGGLCTGSMIDAVDMAAESARDTIMKLNEAGRFISKLRKK